MLPLGEEADGQRGKRKTGDEKNGGRGKDNGKVVEDMEIKKKGGSKGKQMNGQRQRPYWAKDV